MLQIDRLENLLDQLQSEIAGETDESPAERLALSGAALTTTAGVSVISSVADLFSYFKEDTELTGYEVNLSSDALIAAVAASLRANLPGTTIVVPNLSTTATGKLLTKVASLAEKRRKLFEELALLQATRPDSDFRKKNESKIAMATDATAELIESLISPAGDTGTAPIESLAYIDGLQAHADELFLYVGLVGQGGEVEITKSLWTGGRISYIGGSTCVYFLTDATGIVYAAGSPSKYLKAWYGKRTGASSLKIE